MTTQLSLYNGALEKLKERPLANLSENVEARRQLDRVWDSGKAIKACLEQGYWNFAMRTSMFTPDTDFTRAFGYQNRYTKPEDFVQLSAMCADEFFNVPLTAYTDEAGAWFADLNPIYVSYVSNDNDFGMNLDRWPESFVQYVEYYLADRVAGRLVGDADVVKERMEKALRYAKSRDALNEPTKFTPQGNWTASRQGDSYRRDRGNRGQLIG